MSPNPNTKTGRAQLARHARRFGHFHDRAKATIAITCPLCKDRPSGPEPRYGESVNQALDALLDTHLLYDCPKGPQKND
ncbi:hypothetical protein AB0K21_21570 [Streptosporangium sp. NPDC049248]|uniref:hypothetical protein n=1 Tax=Streptosporangium sp. NPDC049248 TaxID=3155651 RepID=UPI00342B3AAC